MEPLNHVLHLGALVKCEPHGDNHGKPFFGRVVSLSWVPAAHGVEATQRARALNVAPGLLDDPVNGQPVRSIEAASRFFTLAHPSEVP